MSLFSLENKVVLITGSTKGIGKAIAMRMAEQGAKVVISSRNQGACDEVAGEIKSAGHQAIAMQHQLQGAIASAGREDGSAARQD
jgi:NAD(P)-dependent dehydrogenase (short-subunit alcohol dehydrogenase family)